MKLKMQLFIFPFLLGLSLFLFQNFSWNSNHLGVVSRPQAPAPTLIKDVHLMNDLKYTTPVVSPFRTTTDGRIGISLESQKNRIYLYRPEQLQKHVLMNSPGVQMLANPSGFEIAKNLGDKLGQITGVYNNGHKTICDGTSAKRGKGNPYSCGANGLDDCYDLNLITYRIYNSNFRLFGLPFTVQVSNPKTNQAKIARVVEGELVLGKVFNVGIQNFFEPGTTADGRLLIGRFGNSPLRWTSSKTNTEQTTTTEIAYFYGSDNDITTYEPCDVRQWSVAYPLSHAPYHERLKQKYGFARYPFRDSVGKVIPDGAQIMATYPWIDKAGKNIMFSTINNPFYRNINGNISTEYPSRCVTGVNCQHPNAASEIQSIEIANSRIKSFGFAGLWTHGKFITFDGTINNTEYGLQDRNELQREIQLYTEPDNSKSWIRVGMGRVKGAGPRWQDGSAGNTTFIESFENIFNYNQYMKPLRIGDVVWTLNSGRTSEDIVFDDYINPNMLIASDMNAAFAFNSGVSGARALSYFSEGNIRLQNSATPPPSYLQIPAFGQVSGLGRVEPVALGGIRGKGFYLFDNTKISYVIPKQKKSFTNWYTGLFVDYRNKVGGQLLKFPDGSLIVVNGPNKILFKKPDGSIDQTIDLPDAFKLKLKKWFHFGIQSSNNQTVEFYLDGVLLKKWNSAFFNIKDGSFEVGNFNSANPKTNAWIDELRVIAENPNVEVKCNYARGTILGGSRSVEKSSDLYQSLVASRLAGSLANQSFECYVSRGIAELNRYNIPSNRTMLRDYLLFPEGPLVFNRQRPDSSNNEFCISCHIRRVDDSLRTRSLRAIALNPRLDTDMEKDGRQPMQPPVLIRGTIPVNFLGDRSPSSVIKHTGGGGSEIDRWLSH